MYMISCTIIESRDISCKLCVLQYGSAFARINEEMAYKRLCVFVLQGKMFPSRCHIRRCEVGWSDTTGAAHTLYTHSVGNITTM